MQFSVSFMFWRTTIAPTLLHFVLVCNAVPNSGDAVTSNSPECASIGMDILKNHNGTTVDAALAVLFCEGVVYVHDNGLGGGFVATIYDKANGEVETVAARERAPLASKSDMFLNMKTVDGILSIAVPGALKGYAEMHKKYGRTPWTVLIRSAINLCRKGFKISKSLDFRLRASDGMPLILDSPSLRELFVDPTS